MFPNVLNEVHDLDYCLNMIDGLVKSTTLPQENKYIEEMKECKHKIELLESNNKHLTEMIDHLKETNEQLKGNIHLGTYVFIFEKLKNMHQMLVRVTFVLRSNTNDTFGIR